MSAGAPETVISDAPLTAASQAFDYSIGRALVTAQRAAFRIERHGNHDQHFSLDPKERVARGTSRAYTVPRPKKDRQERYAWLKDHGAKERLSIQDIMIKGPWTGTVKPLTPKHTHDPRHSR
jgi:hypothetical protein